jgi:hypothetical protein
MTTALSCADLAAELDELPWSGPDVGGGDVGGDDDGGDDDGADDDGADDDGADDDGPITGCVDVSVEGVDVDVG